MKKNRAGGLAAVVILLQVTAMGVLALRTTGVDVQALVLGIASAALFGILYYAVTRLFPTADGLVIVLIGALGAVGMAMLYRINAELAMKHLIFTGMGVLLLLLTLVLVKNLHIWERLIPLYVIAALILLALSTLFGREQFGAKNWFSIAGFSFQPSEFVKVLFIFALAGLLRRQTRLAGLIRVWAFVGACMILLVLQKDLGATLLYFFTAVVMTFVATSNWIVTGAALAGGAVGSVAAYHIFPHVRTRVEIWQNPWASVDSSGYQIVQGLMAIAAGGLFGLGLGQGSPRAIPVVYTDSIFAAICEEMGIIAGLCVMAMYVVLIFRGVTISRRADNAFDMLLAFGSTALIALQAFVNMGGVIKLIPLTGITLPFISYGGSSLLSLMALIGVLEGVAAKSPQPRSAQQDELDQDDFGLEQGEAI